MGTRTSTRRIWIFLALVTLTAIAIVIAVLMSSNDKIKADTLTYELGTRVADAGLATGLGAVVGLLVWQFQQEQAEARQRVDAASQRLAVKHQWLRDFAIQVTDAYADVKQARRRLQWDVDKSAGTLPAKIYDEQLAAISVVQSRFEALHAMADTNLVSNARRSSIATPLKEIDDALSGLISERKGGRLPPSEHDILMSNREKLRAFVAESDEAERLFEGPDGFSRIKTPYKGVIAAIVAELRDDPLSTSR